MLLRTVGVVQALLLIAVCLHAAGPDASTMPSSCPQAQTPTTAAARPSGHGVIMGNVVELGDAWEDITTRLEQASSAEEAEQAFTQVKPSCSPVEGAQVVARGQLGTWTATTGRDGRFRITSLPQDTYDVIAIKPAAEAGTTPMARSRIRRTRVEGRAGATLVVAPTVTIKGRITDQTGQPVAGAAVCGEAIPLLDPQAGEVQETTYVPDVLSTVTDSDGAFELNGFPQPRDPRAAWAYMRRSALAGGGKGTTAILTARAEGYGEVKLVVPLITQDMLERSRRFAKATNRFATKPESQEQADIVLPQSNGNLIWDVNLVIHPATATAPAAQP